MLPATRTFEVHLFWAHGQIEAVFRAHLVKGGTDGDG